MDISDKYYREYKRYKDSKYNGRKFKFITTMGSDGPTCYICNYKYARYLKRLSKRKDTTTMLKHYEY